MFESHDLICFHKNLFRKPEVIPQQYNQYSMAIEMKSKKGIKEIIAVHEGLV